VRLAHRWAEPLPRETTPARERPLPSHPNPARTRGSALAAFESVRHRQIPDFVAWHQIPLGRVVVTGGTGCIGTALLRLLRAHGVTHVASISRRPPGAQRWVPDVDYRLGDIRDFDGVREILRSVAPDLVIHLAGQRQPGLAELCVGETVSSNVIGTRSLLAAAGETGVASVVTASTGKALRYFAPEVYAASKKLTEHLVSQAPLQWGIACSTVRFTHVVDNSLIYERLRLWARAGEPVRLHAPGIGFYAQSAIEAAQLLIASSAQHSDTPTVSVLSDIGWPHDLLDLALDVIEDEASTSAIRFSGYEPGYEDRPFPGTFDPLGTSGSPLLNVLESGRVLPRKPGHPIESVCLAASADAALEHALADLESCWRSGGRDRAMRALLHEASVLLLKKTFADASPDELRKLRRLTDGKVGEVPEHDFIYRHLLAARAAGLERLGGSANAAGRP
jgi:nucleoside-diphosphate-sugar epimerase